jgi:hypothetical protein
MKTIPLFLACLMACQMAAQNAVTVHVVNSVTGIAIAGANVDLEQEDGDKVWGRTDAGGFFAGQAHSAGSHLLTVTRKGYRMIPGATLGRVLEVKAGVKTDVTVQMLPLGVLAGRVLDQFGDPVRHAIVCTEDEVSGPGQDRYYESLESVFTDDRGEYRIAEVEPGKHYVAVEYNSADDQRSFGTRSNYSWPQTGGLVLYPDAAGIEQAQQVEASAGGKTRLNDIQLKIQRAVTISGRVNPPPTDKIQPLSLQRAMKLGLHSSPMIQAASTTADGTFKIDVLPGIYILTASDRKTGKFSRPLTLEVGDKNIANLELELTSDYEVSGRFTVDGPTGIDYSKVRLSLGGSVVKVEQSGIFQASLGGPKAIYNLQGLPEDWYVKEVLVAGRRITGRQLEIDPGSSDLTFILSPRGARVEISLEAANGGLGTAMVVLLPESGAVPDVESVLQGQASPSGEFVVHAVPPGSYRVFTVDASNWSLLFRPDMLLEKNRNSAPLINVAEGERKSIVIPRSKIQPE